MYVAGFNLLFVGAGDSMYKPCYKKDFLMN